MHGVPQNLDLSAFLGAELIQVAIGCHDLQLHFFPEDRRISVWGHWELLDSTGTMIDKAQENPSRDSYKIHRLLGQAVTALTVDAPKSFTLTFDNGMNMTVYDDSDQYESFSIQPGNIFV
jgi:hypothetical protein